MPATTKRQRVLASGVPTSARSNSTPFEPSIELPEDAWREIESAIGLEKPSPEFRCRVAAYVLRNYYELDGGSDVRPGDMKRALEKVSGLSTNLAQYLDVEAGEELLDSPGAWASLYAIDWVLPPKDRKALVATLRAISHNADSLIRRLRPDRGGPPVDLKFVNLICEFAILYRELKGRRPGVTPSHQEVANMAAPFSDLSKQSRVTFFLKRKGGNPTLRWERRSSEL